MFGLRRRVRIAYEPIPWSAQGNRKSKKKQQPISELVFLAEQTEIFKKRAPQGLQKAASEKGVATLGAPLEPQVDFWFKKRAHSVPQSAPGTEKMLKNEPTAPPK